MSVLKKVEKEDPGTYRTHLFQLHVSPLGSHFFKLHDIQLYLKILENIGKNLETYSEF